MVDTKISLLAEVTSPTASDVLPIVSGGETKKVTVANLIHGKTYTLTINSNADIGGTKGNPYTIGSNAEDILRVVQPFGDIAFLQFTNATDQTKPVGVYPDQQYWISSDGTVDLNTNGQTLPTVWDDRNGYGGNGKGSMYYWMQNSGWVAQFPFIDSNPGMITLRGGKDKGQDIGETEGVWYHYTLNNEQYNNMFGGTPNIGDSLVWNGTAWTNDRVPYIQFINTFPFAIDSNMAGKLFSFSTASQTDEVYCGSVLNKGQPIYLVDSAGFGFTLNAVINGVKINDQDTLLVPPNAWVEIIEDGVHNAFIVNSNIRSLIYKNTYILKPTGVGDIGGSKDTPYILGTNYENTLIIDTSLLAGTAFVDVNASTPTILNEIIIKDGDCYVGSSNSIFSNIGGMTLTNFYDYDGWLNISGKFMRITWVASAGRWALNMDAVNSAPGPTSWSGGKTAQDGYFTRNTLSDSEYNSLWSTPDNGANIYRASGNVRVNTSDMTTYTSRLHIGGDSNGVGDEIVFTWDATQYPAKITPYHSVTPGDSYITFSPNNSSTTSQPTLRTFDNGGLVVGTTIMNVYTSPTDPQPNSLFVEGDIYANGTNKVCTSIPREKKLGSDCSLTDGDVNRVLAVTGTPFIIVVDGTVLSETDDWTFGAPDVTFLVPIYDSQKIQCWRIN